MGWGEEAISDCLSVRGQVTSVCGRAVPGPVGWTQMGGTKPPRVPEAGRGTAGLAAIPKHKCEHMCQTHRAVDQHTKKLQAVPECLTTGQ